VREACVDRGEKTRSTGALPSQTGKPGLEVGREGPTNFPRFIRQESAARDGSHRLRMMARALEMITALVPTAGTAFYAFSGRQGRLTTDPIVINISQPDLIDPAERYRAYAARYHALDPFDPRRHADSRTPIVGVNELGGPTTFARTPWASEYLPAWGVATETVMFLREDGRITAGISLARKRGAPDLSPQEQLLLGRCQPLIQEAFAIARQAPIALEYGHRLHARGLTVREIDIARRAAAGATNDEIARALIISPDTVKTHLKHAFAKLGVRSRIQLAVLLGPDGTTSSRSADRV
jgi:DNA-binding CsgD family transcriptional regulator